MTRPLSPIFAALSGAVFVLTFAGCRKPEIRVYTVPREKPAPPVAAATPEPGPADVSADTTPHARPKLDYQVPAGWKDMGANKFSLVNFTIPAKDGDAMVNITPLRGMDGGKDAIIVNMWRQQLQLAPLDEAAATASLTPVKIGGEEGKLFEVSGKTDGRELSIVTAFVHRPDGSWFYKLQGSAAVVAEQKPAFLDFLKTVKVEAGDALAPAAESKPAASAPEEPASSLHVVAPEGWQAEKPGDMQVAKFSVSKADGKADISVSVFSSDTGGTLANVNRWRSMMGLPEVDEAGLADCVTNLGGAAIDGAPGPILADLTKENRRLLGAIVPREGRWWFYKMVGDAPVVNAEHDSFVQFVKSQP